MRAILIDPYKKTIEEIQTTGDLHDIYRILDCHMVECPITYLNYDTMFCDEEAWLYPADELAGFMFPKWDYAILGKAVILGTDDEGESVDARSDIKDFENIIWKSHTDMEDQGHNMGVL